MHLTRHALLLLRLLAAGAALAAAVPAWAHHPMDGAVPATFWQGLLSGLGHPVIEVDHLLFLLGAGAAAGFARVSPRRALIFLAAYALAGALGTWARVPGLEIPYAELAVAASLLAVALWLWFGPLPALAAGALLAALGGWIHGYAYGEAVIGAEATPLAAYLGGLALIQLLLLAGASLAVRSLMPRAPGQLQLAARSLATLLAAAAAWTALA